MKNLVVLFAGLVITSCNTSKPVSNADAQAFIDACTAESAKLATFSAEAQWAANTRIVEGDTTNAKLVESTGEAYAAFTGSKARTYTLAEDF